MSDWGWGNTKLSHEVSNEQKWRKEKKKLFVKSVDFYQPVPCFYAEGVFGSATRQTWPEVSSFLKVTFMFHAVEYHEFIAPKSEYK